ncbi:SGNH/GDSL hydrolase family protein [PVC group bacterium]|nr:SGNH/GDSL hydrolase family protein [PVC group bacterium]
MKRILSAIFEGKSFHKNLSNNAKRVLCVGDSVTLGIGLDNEETFSYQLERRLNQAKLFQGKWDVLNFGVNGYNTINEIEFLKTKGTHYAPDYVILQYCFNDNSNMSHLNVPEFMEKLSENYRLLYYLVNPFTKTLARSHLFLFCATRLKSLKISREDTYKWWVTSEYFYEGNIVEEGFKEFSQMADKNKFKALVLIVPRFENQTRFSDYTENYESIVALCEKYDLAYINLIDVFKGSFNYDARSFHIDDVHLSQYGSSVVARLLFDAISGE